MQSTIDRRDPNRAPKLRYLELDQHWRKTYGHPYPDRRQPQPAQPHALPTLNDYARPLTVPDLREYQPHALPAGNQDISTQRDQDD